MAAPERVRASLETERVWLRADGQGATSGIIVPERPAEPLLIEKVYLPSL